MSVWLCNLYELLPSFVAVKPQVYIAKSQQLRIWEQIIAADGFSTIAVVDIAKLSQRAWLDVHNYQLPFEELEKLTGYYPDTELFVKWANTYKSYLAKYQWIDDVGILLQVLNNLAALKDILPEYIYLHAIDELSPLENKVLASCTTLGVCVKPSELKPLNHANIYVYPDENQQWQAAAKWAYALHVKAHKKIAVVIPNLQQHRQLVMQIFSDYFAEDDVNVSAPYAMGHYPLVKNILIWLKLIKPQIALNDLSCALCQLEYVPASSRSMLAYAVTLLWQTADVNLTWDELVTKFAGFIEDYPELQDFLLLLKKIYELIQYKPLTALPSKWCEYVQKVLVVLGFCSQQGDKFKQDLYSCWNRALLELQQLDNILTEISYTDFLGYLYRVSEETPFLPAESKTSKVQVLGVLEAAGIDFDYLWVSDMDASNWPVEAKPNPLLPLFLQQKFDLPRSGPHRELLLAQNITKTLAQSGKQQLIFSYSAISATGSEQYVSPILTAVFPESSPILKSQDVSSKNTDLQWIPYEQSDQVKVQGSDDYSAQVLQEMSNCPFKAMALFRLNIRETILPTAWLTPQEQGQILHEVLAKICKPNITFDINDDIIQHSIATVLLRWQQRRPYTFSNFLYGVESQRLFAVIKEFLLWQQQNYTQKIHKVETKVSLQLAGVNFVGRIDRVDESVQGGSIIIDYKTGTLISMQNILGDTLSATQLPFYACADHENVIAVAYIQVSLDQYAITIIGADSYRNEISKLEGITDWQQQLRLWHKDLHDLATKFVQGNYQVLPRSKQVCNNCDFSLACRINERKS